MEDNLLLPFIMLESGATVNDTPKIHFTDITSKDHCITFADSELKIPLHINGKITFFHIRRPISDELPSYEKIFITPDRRNWYPYYTSYELNERSMLKYEGDITQENCQEHHLVDHEMDDVNIASITATAYNQNIDNITDNVYCVHFYNTTNNPDSEFALSLNQRDEISKIMGLIGSVTKNDTPCEFFSNLIMVQLEELEGHICDILGPEAVSYVEANISTVQ